ncbi:MAG TPA: EamA family transporter [Xanthobacteraceae bacterium]|jgi:drug/metabolite transporter (DMT)-like permease
MDSLVLAAVLLGAACHAGWNAVIKVGLDTVLTTSLIAIGAGVVALVLLPFVGLPLAAAWPCVFASVMVHLLYFIGLSESYRLGDLGQVYPLARGAAPLMTAALSFPLLGEALGLAAWSGIVVLASGVLLLSARGGRELARFDRHATGLALLTAATICAYSLVDGVGARLAGSAPAYVASLFVGNGIVLGAYVAMRRRRAALPALAGHWRTGLAGGALQVLSYGIAVWAMTVAPIALVAALRESSVLFGSALSIVLLKEPLRRTRVVAALMIVSGLVLVRFS